MVVAITVSAPVAEEYLFWANFGGYADRGGQVEPFFAAVEGISACEAK